MSTRETPVTAPPEAVWDVLCDGMRYADWVVGAHRIRDVDPGWPAPGTRIHHTVGIRLLNVDDHTECVQWDPQRRLVLHARAWPAGTARVDIQVFPDGAGSLVRMHEAPISGVGKWIHNPLSEKVLDLRNVESLRRLRSLVEGRSRGRVRP